MVRVCSTGFLFVRTVGGLLGLDPTIPESLVQGIKERIVIPSVQLEQPAGVAAECTSLDGPYGLRGSAAVGGFTVGNFFGNSMTSYFQAIGSLVSDFDTLAELQLPRSSQRSEIPSHQVQQSLAVTGLHEIRFDSLVSGIKGRAKFEGVLQGLRDGQHVWWCVLDGAIEISDHCSFEPGLYVVDTLRFFPEQPQTQLDFALRFSPHAELVDVVLIGKNFNALYVPMSSGALLTSLAEAATKKMRFKATLPEPPRFRMFDFIQSISDTPTQRSIERAVLKHVESDTSLEQLLMTEAHIMRKYAEFLGERKQPGKILERSEWGADLATRLQQKEKLENLNARLAEALAFLTAHSV